MDKSSAEFVASSPDSMAVNNPVVCETVNGKHGISVLQQQQNNESCDVSLLGKDSVLGINGHKMILASASPHLRDAFKSEGFVDSGAKEYYVEQIDHTTLQAIIDYIYSSTLRLAGDSNNVEERLKSVLVGADYLLMPDLVSVCGENLVVPVYLHVGSAVNLWLFARKYHCQMLEDAAVSTMVPALRAVADQDIYVSLSKEDVMALLRSLVAASPAALPDLVCDAAITWLDYMEERKAMCDEVMRQVPLKAVSTEALQRAGQASFLSEQVLWAIQQLQEVRGEVDKMKLENMSLSSDLRIANEKFAHAKLLAADRRQHLQKMVTQAGNMDTMAVIYYNEDGKGWSNPWINDDKKDRIKERNDAYLLIRMQDGIDN